MGDEIIQRFGALERRIGGHGVVVAPGVLEGRDAVAAQEVEIHAFGATAVAALRIDKIESCVVEGYVDGRGGGSRACYEFVV